MNKKINLVNATLKQFGDLMAMAVELGAMDEGEGIKAKTTKEVLVALGVNEHRKGHATALKQAYSAGRFHVSCMGGDDA